MLLENYLKSLQDDVKCIEKQMSQYGVPSPDGPRIGVNAVANKESLADEIIGQLLLVLNQENAEMLLRCIRTSITNDSIRRWLIKVLIKRANYLDKLIKYLKIKGWLNQPPFYPNIPPENPEVIDTGEAFHIWDQLTFRYDSIEQTQMFMDYTTDGDFKLILQVGLMDGLRATTEALEKEAFDFGLPLPKTPSKNTGRIENVQILKDDSIYRNVLIGMQGALAMHMQAFKQATTNDRIRELFRRFLFDEIGKVDKFIMYGKSKGWLFPPPQF